MTVRGESLQRLATETKVPVPILRYWAETRGDLLGVRRNPDGGWRFSPQAVAFFRRLGQGGEAPDEAAPAVREQAAAPASPEAPKEKPAAPGAGDASSAELRTGLAELAEHVAYLSEETKQVQLLLSRIIELLAPTSGRDQKPRVVRPWRPPRV